MRAAHWIYVDLCFSCFSSYSDVFFVSWFLTPSKQYLLPQSWFTCALVWLGFGWVCVCFGFAWVGIGSSRVYILFVHSYLYIFSRSTTHNHTTDGSLYTFSDTAAAEKACLEPLLYRQCQAEGRQAPDKACQTKLGIDFHHPENPIKHKNMRPQ